MGGLLRENTMRNYTRLKSFLCRLSIHLLLGTVAFFSPTGIAAGELTVDVATGEDFAPFTGSKLPYAGMANRLVVRSFELSDISVNEIEWFPWARVYRSAERGEVDAIFPYVWTGERSKSFYYSDSFFPGRVYALSLRERNLNLRTKNDLRGKVACNPLGYGDFGLMTELIQEKAITRFSPRTMAQCFKMLVKGRVDIVVAGRNAINSGLVASGIDPDKINQEEVIIHESALHLIVSKSHPDASAIIDGFNGGLKVFRASDEFQQLKVEFSWSE